MLETKQNYNYSKKWYAEPTYEYKGKKNITEFPEFIKLCKKTQEELKKTLPSELLKAGYEDVAIGDGYIYAKGTVPVLLTAHMDTVHKETVKDWYEYVDDKGNHIISSPQGIGGDDRCGIYMILEIIKEHKCSVLFCEDEEIGGVGSDKFCRTDLINELKELNYLIELDRAHAKDAVFYDCDNPDFTEFITRETGYVEEYGSFSDISWLSPACGVASVNLSCGYYSAHTKYEEVVVEEMLHTIEIVKKLLKKETVKFEYIERVYQKYTWDKWSGYNQRNYCGNYYDDEVVIVYIDWVENGIEQSTSVEGIDENDCLVQFFMTHPEVCWNDVLDYSIECF